jgi:hypothetical protein
MRRFIADGAGRTLGEAIDRWYATRGPTGGEIAAQFEYNAFVRRRHHDHPKGTAAQARAAWQAHRARPREPAGRSTTG